MERGGGVHGPITGAEFQTEPGREVKTRKASRHANLEKDKLKQIPQPHTLNLWGT